MVTESFIRIVVGESVEEVGHSHEGKHGHPHQHHSRPGVEAKRQGDVEGDGKAHHNQRVEEDAGSRLNNGSNEDGFGQQGQQGVEDHLSDVLSRCEDEKRPDVPMLVSMDGSFF